MEKDHLPSFAGLKFLVLILVVVLSGCPKDSGLPDPDIVQSYVDSGNQVYPLETTGLTEFSYTINLGSTPRDLYYVITNPGTTAAGVPLPVVETVQGGVSGSVRSVTPDTAVPERTSGTESLTGTGRALRDRVGVEEWVPLELVGSRGISTVSRGIVALDELGDTARDGGTIDPFDAGKDGLIDATCRVALHGIETAFGTKNLSIWVADDCWFESSSKSYQITDEMVLAMANAFLKAGADNDIYDWITGIFGEEWGAHSYSNLIPDNDEITILLYDISHDDDPRFVEGKAPPDNLQEWYIAGSFSYKDNYKEATLSSSNERLMFYIDAVAFALSDGIPWAITNPYPQDQISTLAHEFQHMIMYYQKAVLCSKPISSEEFTWLNEMCSLMAEDFVSKNFTNIGLSIQGPRGVDPSDKTAGSLYNRNGRLPLFNYYNERSLTDWAEGMEAITDYSAAYSFGAFLSRNYNGAKLFREIVQSPDTGSAAVVNAIKRATTIDTTFSQLLQDWGAATLLSDKTSGYALEKKQYNSGNWFTDTLAYDLGSINMYNYQYEDGDGYIQNGPWLYYPEYISTYYPGTTQAATSNIYVLAAASATGIVQHNFTVGEGVRVTAVVKDASP